MAIKTIVYEPRAEKALANMAVQVRERIENSPMRYAVTGMGEVKAMTGRPALRMRVGEYRVLFTEDMEILDVLDAGSRGGIYR